MSTRILEFEHRRRDAMVAGDAAELRQLVAPTCVYVHSSGYVDSGAAVTARVADGSISYESVETGPESVTTFPGVTVITFEQTSSVRFEDTSNTSVTRCVAVWSEVDGRPQLVSFQSAPVRIERAA